MIEWTITAGNILTSVLTLAGFVIAALIFFHGLKISLDLEIERLGMLSNEVKELKDEIKELKGVTITLATQTESLRQLSSRVDRVQEDTGRWRDALDLRLVQVADDLRRFPRLVDSP